MPQPTYAFFCHLKILKTFCTLNWISAKYWSNNKCVIPFDHISNPEFFNPNILRGNTQGLYSNNQSEESCKDHISVTRPLAYSDEVVREQSPTNPSSSVDKSEDSSVKLYSDRKRKEFAKISNYTALLISVANLHITSLNFRQL
jgi:hypothetical protein